ncbi:MAG: hypothetical protein R3340_13320, partial [Bizionia paragorgiae]|nr:hypothetical protein [Bizionia paragorgiae]
GGSPNGFTAEMSAWLQSQPKGVVGQISYYIDKNECSETAQAFAIEAVITLMNGGEVDFDEQIIKDSSFIGTDAECVLDELISNENNLFRVTSEAFTGNKSKYKIKFVVGNLLSGGGQASTSLPNENDVILITFDDDAVNGNAIELASTILHETIHAELHRIILTNNAPPNSLDQEIYNWYVVMYNYYENAGYTSNEIATYSEHNLMAAHYINPVANGLRQFDNNSQPVSSYEFFAWTGLNAYGLQRQLINSTQLQNLANLSLNVHNDEYTNPCDL